MERELNTFRRTHSGFVLPLVLIMTMVGALFGAGSLLLFKYQCCRRINRQHELEKVYAVRSAANYARAAFNIADEKSFEYKTSSGRDLRLLVKPVEAIFPNPLMPEHLDISSKTKHFSALQGAGQYCKDQDYEYGCISNDSFVAVTESQISYSSKQNCLAFKGVSSEAGARWWVNIGMKYIRGWLQQNFGMRYLFRPNNWVYGKDYCMRLCLIRNKPVTVSGEGEDVGRRYGWPLSGGESALVLEMRPGVNADSWGVMTLYQYKQGVPDPTPIMSLMSPNTCWMGLQVAGRNVYLFYIQNDISDCGCVLSERWEMPDGQDSVYRSLTENNSEDGLSDLLRVVIECEAKGQTSGSDMNSIQYFKVTPAYQYDVYVKSPEWNEYEKATVIQKHGVFDFKDCYPAGSGNFKQVKYSLGFEMRSYDTHGTAWKGYKRRN